MEYKLISNIYNSRRVLIDQLTQAGYNTQSYFNFTISEINAMVASKQLDMLLTHLDTDVTAYVRYSIDSKVSETILDNLCTDLFDPTPDTDKPVLSKNDILIVIFQYEINENITNKLKTRWEQFGEYIIPLTITRLQFNVLHHQLVPRHRIMGSVEVDELLRKNHMTFDQLPKISRFDPVALAICIRPGQVCEIVRSSKTSIQSLYYRICVNSDFNM